MQYQQLQYKQMQYKQMQYKHMQYNSSMLALVRTKSGQHHHDRQLCLLMMGGKAY